VATLSQSAKHGVSETTSSAIASGVQAGREVRALDHRADDDAYYHPLMPPQGFTQLNLGRIGWAENPGGRSVKRSVRRPALRRGLAPKLITTPSISDRQLRLHLDAGNSQDFCSSTARQSSECVMCSPANDGQSIRAGDISSLDTQQAGEISGDLFIDCTGFAALLLGKTLGVAFKDCSDICCAMRPWRAGSLRHAGCAHRVPHHIHRSSCGWIWTSACPPARHRLCVFHAAQHR